MTHNYFKELDLNPPPALGGPILNPLDPRAHNDFCFLSDWQEIVLARSQSAGSPVRVLFSFSCGHQPLLNQPFPPPGTGPEVHGLLVFDPAVGDDPLRRVFREQCCHQRRHVKVWIDPTGPQPPTGIPVIVTVAAGAKDAGC